MNLREEKGYTYGARTSFDLRRGAGRSCCRRACSRKRRPTRCRKRSASSRRSAATRPVTREELVLGRAALTRGYPRNFETGEQIARGAAQLALYDLPDDYFSTFVPTVLSLTEADVTRAARDLHPSRTAADGDRRGPRQGGPRTRDARASRPAHRVDSPRRDWSQRSSGSLHCRSNTGTVGMGGRARPLSRAPAVASDQR